MTKEMHDLTNDIYDLTIRLGRHIEKVEQVNADLEFLQSVADKLRHNLNQSESQGHALPKQQ